MENFQELNLGKVLFLPLPPRYTALALWRVITFSKEALSLFSLWVTYLLLIDLQFSDIFYINVIHIRIHIYDIVIAWCLFSSFGTVYCVLCDISYILFLIDVFFNVFMFVMYLCLLCIYVCDVLQGRRKV